ncbi:hypothetical protein DINM_002186 [Dirofilaria immitis]|nr:hypothetical protein [Dirofilaria immitis]
MPKSSPTNVPLRKSQKYLLILNDLFCNRLGNLGSIVDAPRNSTQIESLATNLFSIDRNRAMKKLCEDKDQVNVFIASTKLARIEKWFWKIAEDSINSITLNRSMRINASNDSVEESTDLILCNSQTASFPAITHLWRAPQPFIPYYFTSSPPQFSQFSSYLPYYSKTTATTPQQKYQNKKRCGNQVRAISGVPE